eukprot:2647172-Amphidinium_carterae.1
MDRPSSSKHHLLHLFAQRQCCQSSLRRLSLSGSTWRAMQPVEQVKSFCRHRRPSAITTE